MDGLVALIDESEGYLDKCPITIKSKEDIMKTIDLITQKKVMLEGNLLTYDEVVEIRKELDALVKSLARQAKGIRW